MDSMLVIASLLVTIVLLRFVFKIDFKKAEKLNENKELEKITDKFPENRQIAEEMLEMIDNKSVKIEEAKDSKTSLYIAVTKKIIIADFKSNYARIQTIAHECLHSIQDKRLLLFNFIFSNIFLLFWITMCILTFTKVITDTASIIFALMLFTLIKILVRGFLETDAMTKSRYLAEKYIDKKHIISNTDKEKLLEQYDEINKLGIPFTLVRVLLTPLIEVIIYTCITLII